MLRRFLECSDEGFRSTFHIAHRGDFFAVTIQNDESWITLDAVFFGERVIGRLLLRAQLFLAREIYFHGYDVFVGVFNELRL